MIDNMINSQKTKHPSNNPQRTS